MLWSLFNKLFKKFLRIPLSKRHTGPIRVRRERKAPMPWPQKSAVRAQKAKLRAQKSTFLLLPSSITPQRKKYQCNPRLARTLGQACSIYPRPLTPFPTYDYMQDLVVPENPEDYPKDFEGMHHLTLKKFKDMPLGREEHIAVREMRNMYRNHLFLKELQENRARLERAAELGPEGLERIRLQQAEARAEALRLRDEKEYGRQRLQDEQEQMEQGSEEQESEEQLLLRRKSSNPREQRRMGALRRRKRDEQIKRLLAKQRDRLEQEQQIQMERQALAEVEEVTHLATTVKQPHANSNTNLRNGPSEQNATYGAALEHEEFMAQLQMPHQRELVHREKQEGGIQVNETIGERKYIRELAKKRIEEAIDLEELSCQLASARLEDLYGQDARAQLAHQPEVTTQESPGKAPPTSKGKTSAPTTDISLDSSNYRFILYDAKWDALKTTDSLTALTFWQLPWPLLYDITHPDQVNSEAIQEFIFHPDRFPGLSPRKRLTMEILRWHPDKFNAMVKDRLEPDHISSIFCAAGMVARVLTELLKENALAAA